MLRPRSRNKFLALAAVALAACQSTPHEPAPFETNASVLAAPGGGQRVSPELERLLDELPWAGPFLGDKIFRRVVMLAFYMNPGMVSGADLDTDGDLDLLWAQTAADRVMVFLQIAPKSFSPSPLAIAATSHTLGPVALDAEDIDADGSADVVVACWDTGDLAVFYQIAPGIFSRTPTRLVGDAPLRAMNVYIEDVDADGDADIRACDEKDADLAVFLQVAPRTFELAD